MHARRRFSAELDHVVVFRKESYRKCSVCSWLGSSGRGPMPRGACKVFRKLQSSGVQLTSLVYNALLDSCVQCGKVASASGGLARSVSCETMLRLIYETFRQRNRLLF